jgi:hypothetical protein
MTPLGLHVISPVPPNPSNPPTMAPTRNVGFSPTYAPTADDNNAARRGSTASTSSTLTQTRPQLLPGHTSHPAYPVGFNRDSRRSSLTPSLPTLAPVSPTRTHASGRIHTRPSSNEEIEAIATHTRTRTADHTGTRSSTSVSSSTGSDFSRRGSMPQLSHHGWGGPSTRAWNPTLTPQRGSLAEEAAPPSDEFKFGLGPPKTSAATAALKNLDPSTDSRRGSSASRKLMDAFAETEAEEAEKQRRAFLAATYGEDGKRARERLSFAGPSVPPQKASPGTPSATLRRQSLMLWERINTAASAARLAEEGGVLTNPQSLPTIMPVKSVEDLGVRRGSLPLAIPGSQLGRSPSRRRDRIEDVINAFSSKSEEERSDDTSEDEEDDVFDGVSNNTVASNLLTNRANFLYRKDPYHHYCPCQTPDPDYYLQLSHYIEQITCSTLAICKRTPCPILFHLHSIPPRPLISLNSISTSFYQVRKLNLGERVSQITPSMCSMRRVPDRPPQEHSNWVERMRTPLRNSSENSMMSTAAVVASGLSERALNPLSRDPLLSKSRRIDRGPNGIAQGPVGTSSLSTEMYDPLRLGRDGAFGNLARGNMSWRKRKRAGCQDLQLKACCR